MKKELITVKELAAELRMSVKSIQRGYLSGEVPVQWLRRMARFDLAEVRRAMKRNGRGHVRLNGKRKNAERDCRPRPAARPAKRPRSVKRGRVSQRSERTIDQPRHRPRRPERACDVTARKSGVRRVPYSASNTDCRVPRRL